MADLTRFDFHVHRFLNSEDVERMTAEEVGQYILLLCKSWILEKDASLPDDLEYMARHARARKEVSPLVLKKFPLVETQFGVRRQNPTLYAEWKLAQERRDMAKEYGRRGGEAKAASRHPLGTLDTPSPMPKNEFVAHTIPNQSYQTNHTDSDTESFGHGTFKNISIHYSSHFGISHSHSKKHVERYQAACQKYGEDKVLEYFDRWAESSSWLREKRDRNGLNFFWRPLEEIAEGDELRIAREQDEKKATEPEISEVEAERIAETIAVSGQEQVQIELEKIKQQKQFEEETKFEI